MPRPPPATFIVVGQAIISEQGGGVSPATGDPRFKKLLDQMWELHKSKGGDYGTPGDNFANYHRARALGVKPSMSVLLRAGEKWARVENLIGNNKGANHESLEDNLFDLAAQCLIGIILRKEEADLDSGAGPG